MSSSVRRTVAETALWSVTYGALHSMLASHPAKELAERLVGRRYRNGLYRLLYNGQALLGMALVAWRLLKLPDRELYRVPPPFSWLMRTGQIASAAAAVATLRSAGFAQFAGFTEGLSLLAGKAPAREPEGQGPLVKEGRLRAEGPFAYTRHPANWSLLGIMLLFPKVNARLATVNILTTAYMVIGSLHEEKRFIARYGKAYRRYQGQVPFFLLPRRRSRQHVAVVATTIRSGKDAARAG